MQGYKKIELNNLSRLNTRSKRAQERSIAMNDVKKYYVGSSVGSQRTVFISNSISKATENFNGK